MGAKICSLKIETQPQRGKLTGLSQPAAGNDVSVVIWNSSAEFKRVSRAKKPLTGYSVLRVFPFFFSATGDQQIPFLLIAAVTGTTAGL